MFRNYIKVTIRNILKHKGYALINVLGLAVGITCTSLILLFVQEEISFDKHNLNHDRIYRLIEAFRTGDTVEQYPSSPFPVTPALQSDFGFDVTVVRLFKVFNHIPLIRAGENRFAERQFFFADSSFFEVFTSIFLQGNPATA